MAVGALKREQSALQRRRSAVESGAWIWSRGSAPTSRFNGGTTAIALDVIDRCKALEDRGLHHDLARDLCYSGNVTLLGEFEALTDAQILAVTTAAR